MDNKTNELWVDVFAAVLVVVGFLSLYAAIMVDAGWLT